LPHEKSIPALQASRKALARYFTQPVVGLLAKTPVTPNALTVCSLLVTVGAAVLVATEHFVAAALVLLFASFFDILDGALARATNRVTRFGAALDSTLDRLAEAVILIGMIVLISLATFRSNGDVGRWAAISTMWIIIPILLAGLILLAILIGLIYLMARALGALPHYTGIAQDYVYKARGYIIRGANIVAKPMITLGGFIENIKAFLERIRYP